MNASRALPALLLAALLSATMLPAQATFTPGTPQVDELRRLYARAGLAFPAAGFPLSARDLAEAAERLGEALETDGGAGGAAGDALAAGLERYRALLGYDPGRTRIGVANRIAVEGYLRGGPVRDDEAREYRESEPLYRLGLSWSRPERAAFYIQGGLRREWLGEMPSSNLPGASSGNPIALENDQVARGYLWYDFDPLQLQLGRDVVHFGPLRSALLPSARLPYMDMLRLTLPLNRLRMDLMIASLHRTSAAEWAEVAGFDPELYDPVTTSGPGRDLSKTVILTALHRFEYDFGPVRAAVTGHAVYARPGNYFSLVDFFPVFSWHATAIDPYNMSLIFDLEAVPLPGLRVAAQFGFDDINTNAVGVGDEGIPTIPAAIVGAEYARPVESVDLALYAEAGWTHYLWGGFNDEYAPARAVYRLKRDGENLLLPLTSPYGPGNAWVFTEATARWPRGESLRVFAELVFHRQGADFLVPFHADSDLADNPMEGTLALGGEVRGRPWRWLEAWVRPTWFYGAEGGWVELVLGSAVDLDWRRTVPQRPLTARPAAEGGGR